MYAENLGAAFRRTQNFNDGFGGGNTIHDDLLFNSCRESSDHGPFNSVRAPRPASQSVNSLAVVTLARGSQWDRQPYMTEIGDGTASLEPAYNHIVRT